VISVSLLDDEIQSIVEFQDPLEAEEDDETYHSSLGCGSLDSFIGVGIEGRLRLEMHYTG
jgi:hypothetical protein